MDARKEVISLRVAAPLLSLFLPPVTAARSSRRRVRRIESALTAEAKAHSASRHHRRATAKLANCTMHKPKALFDEHKLAKGKPDICSMVLMMMTWSVSDLRAQ
jgi:hypothetical protein